MSGCLKVGGAWIDGGCFEKVVVNGLIEQRLDVTLQRVVASARIVEELEPPLRRQRQCFVKQSFDVQPVLWIHRTPGRRGLMVAYRATCEGLQPGTASTPERPPFQGIITTRPCDSGYPMSAIGVRNPFLVSTT